MKVYTATFIASSLSGIALVLSLLAISQLCQDVNSIWNELDREMMTFRDVTNDLWADIMKLGKQSGRARRQAGNNGKDEKVKAGLKSKGEVVAESSNGTDDRQETARSADVSGSTTSSDANKCVGKHCSKQPIKGCVGSACASFNQASGVGGLGRDEAPGTPYDTQAPAGPPAGNGCNCQIKNNKCPAGPPGPKGASGPPGSNAPPGIDGVAGKGSEDITLDLQATPACYYCPAGPVGPPGAMGRSGPRGMQGANGMLGHRGMDGQPGFPGDRGDSGQEGLKGVTGSPGAKGFDGRKPMGGPGPKGKTGPPGNAGEQGDYGNDVLAGPEGPAGKQGPPGPPGPEGPDGVTGPIGRHGKTGRDAE
ncbi:unnamed protein product, partial [Anisakis simplex]|uniref:Col_cuticle_N domain-containing protein n=1 Tax=Anisakis simplex TaxID=6269 RepID=A0A0M3IZ68_ANISI